MEFLRYATFLYDTKNQSVPELVLGSDWFFLCIIEPRACRIFVRGECRRQTGLDYAEPMPKIMSEANKGPIVLFLPIVQMHLAVLLLVPLFPY